MLIFSGNLLIIILSKIQFYHIVIGLLSTKLVDIEILTEDIEVSDSCVILWIFLALCYACFLHCLMKTLSSRILVLSRGCSLQVDCSVQPAAGREGEVHGGDPSFTPGLPPETR